MNLEQFQRTFFELMRQPLTARDRMRVRTLDGRPIRTLADELVKPSNQLTSFERLELYSQGYWFRILAALGDDFPGLRALVGRRQFDRLAAGYLTECPPDSFDLRKLGARLETWLARHPHHAPKRARVALDMVRLEWAEIEAKDAAQLPKLTAADLGRLGDDPAFRLQPCVKLLELAYPVDVLLMNLGRQNVRQGDAASIESPARAGARRRGIPKREKIYLAIHRQENTVYSKRLEPPAFALLRALQEGSSLSQAIRLSVGREGKNVEGMAGQLQRWFSDWSALGWFAVQ
ncbi:MAG: hypothetical protein QOG83_1369 [Alphaproteobacteria bacterium]|nr:hypothetical protein [Alphaproteobacteria bacterium]